MNMNEETKTSVPVEPVDPSEDLDKTVAAAMALEEAAKQEPDVRTYVHTFEQPFVWEGKSYDKLTFQWDVLTGADHLEIENELLAQGKTLVVPEYTGGYLLGIAARACAE